MPLGYECRAKHIKQNKLKPTTPRGDGFHHMQPSPLDYEPPKITGGKGYSHIRRAPAYTFGLMTPQTMIKPNVSNQAPGLNLTGCTNKGPIKIPNGVIGMPTDFSHGDGLPGPAAYEPHHQIRVKRPPAFSLGRRWRPPFVQHDMWSPPANMYLPAMPKRKPPAYTMGYNRNIEKLDLEGPRNLQPKYEYVLKSAPAFSFGYPHRKCSHADQTPAMNTYCDKKFMVPYRSAPAPSFGIRHTPYLGKQDLYLKTSALDLAVRAYE